MQGFVSHVCAVSTQIRLRHKLIQFLGHFSAKKRDLVKANIVLGTDQAKVEVVMEVLPSHLGLFLLKAHPG